MRLVLEVQNKDQVKVDVLQQLSQTKNCFNNKDEVEQVCTNSYFYALQSEPSAISSTRTNHLKIDDSLNSSKLRNYVMNSFKNEIPILSCSIVIFKN